MRNRFRREELDLMDAIDVLYKHWNWSQYESDPGASLCRGAIVHLQKNLSDLRITA